VCGGPNAIAPLLAKGVGRASLGYLVLAIAATWPLARRLDSAVPHGLGDPLLVTYLLNWNATITPLTERWWHPPFFWPTTNVMTLSEHMLGLSLIATPLRWIGFGALATYNLLFIASFWSAGVAGWFLGRSLTAHWLPAWTCGLVFMLAPYRFSHLPHLQILMSCGVPVMFAALHRALAASGGGVAPAASSEPSEAPGFWTASRRASAWVLVAIGGWLWQGLVSGYFLAFLPIGVVFWLLWFARDRWSLWARLAVAGGAGALAVAPILHRYMSVHAAGGFKRQMSEVLEFSADVAGLWQVSDRLAIWGGVLPKGFVEEQLFPGIATLVLAVAGLATLPRLRTGVRSMTWLLLGLAVFFLAAAAFAASRPPEIQPFSMPLTLTRPFLLGMAWLFLMAAAFSTKTIAAASAERSPAAGYLLIAVGTWILGLGPSPTLYGESIWYRAPYSWLYEYAPGFEEFRVPARLYVITIAAFAALAALGAERLLRARRPLGVPLVLMLGALVVAEGWLGRMPLVAAPRPIAVPAGADLVIELPAGDAARDSAAMYRGLFHHRPVANGWSGYMPKSMDDLIRIDRGDATPLLEWASGRQVAVIVHRDAAALPRYQDLLRRVGAQCLEDEATLVCTVSGG
jgi:hypothetical protein